MRVAGTKSVETSDKSVMCSFMHLWSPGRETGRFAQQDSSGSRKAKRFSWLVMDVVGENEALQQFFEGKSLVLRHSLNNLLWQQKYSNCLGLIEEEEKTPRNRSSIYPKVACNAIPKRNSTSGVDALQCVFLGIMGRVTKERWILWCSAGNCQEENQEVAEVSSQLIPSAAIVIFMRLGSSLPTLPHHVRLQSVFFPLKIPLKLFDCNWIWEIKSQYFCLFVCFGWDLSLRLFPKDIWHSGRTRQSLAFLLPQNLLSTRSINQTASQALPWCYSK